MVSRGACKRSSRLWVQSRNGEWQRHGTFFPSLVENGPLVLSLSSIFSHFVSIILRVNFLWLWRRNVVIFPLIITLFTLLCYYCPFEEVCSCSLKLCFVPCSVEIGLLAPKEIRFFKITQILCSYVSYFFSFFCTDRLQINNTIKRWQCKPNTWSYGTIASFSNSRYRSNAPKPHSRTHAITLTHQYGSRTLVFALKHHRLVPETSYIAPTHQRFISKHRLSR